MAAGSISVAKQVDKVSREWPFFMVKGIAEELSPSYMNLMC